MRARTHHSPPTLTAEETYRKILAAESLPTEVERLDGFSLCWIGSKTAKSIIVYVCGGGLIANPLEAHIKKQISGYKIMEANGQDVSIVIVAHSKPSSQPLKQSILTNYSALCPASPYPTQLRQMVLTLQHLLKSHAASSIHLSGDSSGGMLHVATLLHVTHPHPSVPPLALSPHSKFASAFLISPSATYVSDAESLAQEPQKDIVTAPALKSRWDTLTSTSEPGIEMPNPWIVASLAPEEWWRGLPIGKVVVMLGDYEILKDNILTFARGIEKHHDAQVEIHNFTNEVHCQALVDIIMGAAEESESAKLWKQWFKDFKS